MDKSLLDRLARIKPLVGHTPTVSLSQPFSRTWAKLEYCQFTESIKVRAALRIVEKAIHRGDILCNTTVIESTSGNFGLALANICRVIGISFVGVVDPNISPSKEKLLRLLAHRVVKVEQRDETGGYLLNRLREIEHLKNTLAHVYHANQYENADNYMAYYHTLAEEIIALTPTLEYLFVSVSTCGTVRGLSKRLKEHWPKLKIVAVDVEGSQVFGTTRRKRNISGMGSSLKPAPEVLVGIDRAVILSEQDIVQGTRDLHNFHNIFAGPSSGAAYAAARQIMRGESSTDAATVIVCPDSGKDYIDTVYDDAWVRAIIGERNQSYPGDITESRPVNC